jgi:threonine dehydrogenase-like Zn-dependent dehydrogenase
MSISRAAQIVGIGRIEFVEAPLEALRDGDLLVRSQLASICGSDLHVVNDGVETDPEFWVPGYPGHEGIGVVVESRASGFVPGDQVLCAPVVAESRGFSEFQRIKASSVVKLEGALPPPEQVLMAQQLGTVLFADRQHPVDVTGRTVAILGQGSAGLFWAWLMRRKGAAQVIVADLSPARLAASPGFGADVALDANEVDVTAAVLDLTSGAGADYVIEAVGRRATLLQSIALARPQGALFWFGLPDSNDSVPIDFRGFFRKRLRAHSTYGAQVEPGLVSFRHAVEIIRRGEIDVTPLLSHVLPIEEVARAFALADSRDDGALKVSLRW